jgi:hypothetical protein
MIRTSQPEGDIGLLLFDATFCTMGVVPSVSNPKSYGDPILLLV